MKNKKTLISKKVPLEWHFPDNIITRFATNMIVQIMENEFKISFFEINPPFRLDGADSLPEKVTANCVASVIVTADRLPKFIEVLQMQLDQYQSRHKQSDIQEHSKHKGT